MKTLRKFFAALLVAGTAFAGTAMHPATSDAQVYHHRHIVRSSTTGTTYYGPYYSNGVVVTTPSPNVYDRGHWNAYDKTRERWANTKQTVRYNAYRLTHGGHTTAAERAADARREALDRAHEAEYRARLNSER